MGGHSSRAGLATGLQQSTRTTGRSSPCAVPIRSCSRWGLPCRSRCRGRGALLPHPFYLARSPEARRAVCFLWHCPWGRPRRALPGTVAPWSPDFPPRIAARRPPGPLMRRADKSFRTSAQDQAFCRRPRARRSIQIFFLGSSSSSPSRWSNSRSRIARHSPSAMPSIVSGRKRRWKAVTAAGPSLTS